MLKIQANIKANKLLPRFLGLMLCSGMLMQGITTAQAAEEERREPPSTRSSETLGRAVYTRIEKVMECRDLEDLACMRKELDEVYEMYEKGTLNGREQQTLFMFYADIEQSQENYPAALEWHKRILTIETLAPEIVLQTWNTVGILYFILEDYRKAIEAFDTYNSLALVPDDDVYLRLAHAYYSLDEYTNAIPPLLHNFELLRANGEEVPKNSYTLLRALYLTTEDYPKAYQTLRESVVLFNDPTEWIMLAQVASELENFNERSYLYYASYHGGFMDSPSHFKTMAQLHNQHENPYMCGEVMAQGIESGMIPDEQDNLILGGTCYQIAREWGKAVPFFDKAATKYPTGDNYASLGNAHLANRDWDNAAKAFEKAFEEGELDREDRVALSAARAYLALNKFDEATRMARIAVRDRRSADTGRTWVTVIEIEKKNYENSQQKRRELAGYFR